MIPGDRRRETEELKTSDPWELFRRTPTPAVVWDDYAVLVAEPGETETLDITREENALGIGATVLETGPSRPRAALRFNRGDEILIKEGDEWTGGIIRHLELRVPAAKNKDTQIWVPFPPPKFYDLGLWGAER